METKRLKRGIYRHLQTAGTYRIIAEDVSEANRVPVVVYQSTVTGQVWTRTREQFTDGRFQLVGIDPEALAFNPLGDIKAFHEKYGLDYLGDPRSLSQELSDFRHKFMLEEANEWVDHAKQTQSLEDQADYAYHLGEQLDAIVDLLYVVLGTSYMQGLNGVLPEAWARVHAANMSKVRATSADQSKRGSIFDVVKPLGWEPPDHSDLVEFNDRSGDFL